MTCLVLRPRSTSTLLPYTTLFRSAVGSRPATRMCSGAPSTICCDEVPPTRPQIVLGDRKSTRLNSSHTVISYAVFCLKKKKTVNDRTHNQHELPRTPHR